MVLTQSSVRLYPRFALRAALRSSAVTVSCTPLEVSFLSSLFDTVPLRSFGRNVIFTEERCTTSWTSYVVSVPCWSCENTNSRFLFWSFHIFCCEALCTAPHISLTGHRMNAQLNVALIFRANFFDSLKCSGKQQRSGRGCSMCDRCVCSKYSVKQARSPF